MENYYDKRLSELESRLGGNSGPYGYKSREQQLEEENKTLRQQIQQYTNVDPLLTEFRNSPEHQIRRQDNFLTFLWFNSFPMWAKSDQGKEFEEWEKAAFEEFKKKKQQRSTQLSAQVPQQNNPQGGY